MLKLPAGKYYIGDPCYVIRDADWTNLLDVANFFQDEDIVVFQEQELFAAGTAYGDGTYQDQNGAEYSVDSGLLGAVPIGLVDNPDGESLGTVIDAPNGLKIKYEDGVFRFGDIVIDTKGQDDFDDAHDGDPDDDDL